jgi:hypothetical protein
MLERNEGKKEKIDLVKESFWRGITFLLYFHPSPLKSFNWEFFDGDDVEKEKKT